MSFPAGLMFGVANQVLTKRKMSQFLDMPHNVHSEWLLSDHKVKGAMKTGTTGRKIGPMRMMTGFHEDGQPVSLKMIVSNRRARGGADQSAGFASGTYQTTAELRAAFCIFSGLFAHHRTRTGTLHENSRMPSLQALLWLWLSLASTSTRAYIP